MDKKIIILTVLILSGTWMAGQNQDCDTLTCRIVTTFSKCDFETLYKIRYRSPFRRSNIYLIDFPSGSAIQPLDAEGNMRNGQDTVYTFTSANPLRFSRSDWTSETTDRLQDLRTSASLLEVGKIVDFCRGTGPLCIDVNDEDNQFLRRFARAEMIVRYVDLRGLSPDELEDISMLFGCLLENHETTLGVITKVVSYNPYYYYGQCPYWLPHKSRKKKGNSVPLCYIQSFNKKQVEAWYSTASDTRKPNSKKGLLRSSRFSEVDADGSPVQRDNVKYVVYEENIAGPIRYIGLNAGFGRRQSLWRVSDILKFCSLSNVPFYVGEQENALERMAYIEADVKYLDLRKKTSQEKAEICDYFDCTLPDNVDTLGVITGIYDYNPYYYIGKKQTWLLF